MLIPVPSLFMAWLRSGHVSVCRNSPRIWQLPMPRRCDLDSPACYFCFFFPDCFFDQNGAAGCFFGEEELKLSVCQTHLCCG